MTLQPFTEQSFQLVKSASSPLLPEEYQGLSNAFLLTAGDLYEEPGGIVEWQGVELLRGLVRRRKSCVVISELGAGKATAAASADEEVEDMMTILEPNLPGIYLSLWQKLGMPWESMEIRCQRYKNHRVSTCANCKQGCIVEDVVNLSKDTLRYASLLPYRSPTPDDIIELLNRVGLDKRCPFIMKAVHIGLSLLPKLIVLRLPYVENTEIKHVVSLLSRLLRHDRQLIILADKGQENWLQAEELKRLPRAPFPQPDINLLAGIVSRRMERAGVNKIPISPESLNLLALLTKRNPGRFGELINLVLLSEKGLIQPQDILAMVSTQVDEEEMVAVALSQRPEGWFQVTDLKDIIYEMFKFEITNERLGRYLRRLGLKHRRIGGSGMEYLLDDNKPKLRVKGIKTIALLK